MKQPFLAIPALALAALAGGVAAFPAAATRPAAESDQFFAAGKVLHLAVELGPKETDALRRAPRQYVKATLKLDGKVVGREVGVHLKGAAGSFRGIDDKPSLTVKMDKFHPGQRFGGMAKFHLANSLQDGSYLSELITGELFRDAGVPASRIGHAVVTVNGRRRGLYYLKEGYDRHFRKRHFGTAWGNFYDGGFLRDVDQPLQLLSGNGDVKAHADLKALTAAARERDLRLRFKKLDRLLDLDRFLAFVALEVIIWDWDGYPMNRNNYRIYHDPRRDKIIFLPSGMDQVFGDAHGTLFPNFQGFVARALLETPNGREMYVAKVEQVLRTVFRPDALVKRLDELEKRVQPALVSVDAGAGRGYVHQVNRLRQAIRQRAKNVESQLQRLKK